MSNFLKIKKNINSVVKYEAGISKFADRKKIIKLSSNEGAFGTNPKIKKILKEFEKKIFRYPDPESNKLKEVISKKYKINKNNIICGNGSDEILTIIAKIFSSNSFNIFFIFELVPKARSFEDNLIIFLRSANLDIPASYLTTLLIFLLIFKKLLMIN